MTKMVNCWNEWDPLKRVIVGRPEGTCIPAPNPGWQHDLPEADFPLGTWGRFPDEMVDEANEQMEYFVSVMEKRGIIVDRVTIHPSMLDDRAISTPDWTQINQHGINNPRDLFLPVGNEIQEATCCRRERWFEYLNLRPLFEQYFKEDPEFLWTSAPRPAPHGRVLREELLVQLPQRLDRRREERAPPRLGASRPPRRSRCGTPLTPSAAARTSSGRPRPSPTRAAWTGSSATGAPRASVSTTSGSRPTCIPWHIDVDLTPVRPGLALYNPVKTPFTPEFTELMKMNDWELVPAVHPTWIGKIPIRLYGEFGAPSWISMNTFSLGPNTICVESHETAFMEQLDQIGVEVIPIPYEKVIAFGGALHCTTLDVYREGECEDYFPNQVEGY